MNEKYKQFLKDIEIIDEATFIEIINSLPDFNIEEVDWSNCCFDDKDDLCTTIMYHLSDYYVDWCDFDAKEYSICYTDSLEELESIKNTFNGWKLTNYEDVKKEIEEEQKEKDEREEMLRKLSSLSNNDLKELFEHAKVSRKIYN